MALPTVQDVKDYTRNQSGTVEDGMLAGWLAQTVATVEAIIGRPITLLSRTFVLEQRHDGVSATKLFVPSYPVAAGLTLTDGNDATLVEETDYRIDRRTGVLTSLTGCFATYPYTIVADVGLEAFEEYTDRIEPVIASAILDLMADRYQRRNPAATQEGAADAGTSYAGGGVPQRVIDLLAPWRVMHL